MKEKGYGTIKLAEDSGVNKGTISLWRKGQKRYTIKTVTKVASHLDTTAEDLLDLPATSARAAPRKPAAKKPSDARRGELLRRIAALSPVIEKLPELEALVAEAKKLSQE